MERFLKDLEADWRFEYKYRLTYSRYLQIRSAILPYMKKDRYTLAAPAGKYLVRSLYYDTDGLDNYVEKVNGDCDRVKLRIRTYSPTPPQDGLLRVELKARKGMAMEKHSIWVGFEAYQNFIVERHWLQPQNAVLAEFERYVHLKSQRPKIIVEYRREGFASRSGDDIRVTFDHQVRSARAASLFPQALIFRKHYPGMVVFEIKCTQSHPHWLRALIRDYGLRLTTNSKYAQGIEIARPDLARATWGAI